VVLLDYFDIKRFSEELGGLLGDIGEKIYSQGHIAASEDGDFFARVLYEL
jgi:hypothetical protein